MNLTIPGYDKTEFNNLILDYNGTIALDGGVIAGVANKMKKISNFLNIHIVTGDTYGNVLKKMCNYPCKISIISNTNQAIEKFNYIKTLGAEKTIAIGNGRNDELMLKEAGLGIALVQKEGVYTKTFFSSDLIFVNIIDAFDALLNSNRLKATLRN